VIPIRVFLVEDMPTMRELLNELFASSNKFRLEGISTTEAEAKLWLDEHPEEWDVAIVDLILAEGSGFGVVERARRVAPSASIVVFSGYVTPGVSARCTQLGANAAIDKAQPNGLLRWLDAYRPAQGTP
jgi:two-component system, OmpR family, response regulator